MQTSSLSCLLVFAVVTVSVCKFAFAVLLLNMITPESVSGQQEGVHLLDLSDV